MGVRRKSDSDSEDFGLPVPAVLLSSWPKRPGLWCSESIEAERLDRAGDSPAALLPLPLLAVESRGVVVGPMLMCQSEERRSVSDSLRTMLLAGSVSAMLDSTWDTTADEGGVAVLLSSELPSRSLSPRNRKNSKTEISRGLPMRPLRLEPYRRERERA